VKTQTVCYYIALALWKEHTKGKPEPENITYANIDKWISRIAGYDSRTIQKYRALLEEEGYITATSPETYEIPKEPKKPKSPTDWIASLKRME